MQTLERRIIIHPYIIDNEMLLNLERCRFEDVYIPRKIQPIAVIRMFKVNMSPMPDNLDRRHSSGAPQPASNVQYTRQQIGVANLYHQDDIKNLVECSQKEYQIVTIGRSSDCSLNPRIAMRDGKSYLDTWVSKYQCAISLNLHSNHIQISDIGGSEGSTNGTYVNGIRIHGTIPLPEKTVVGIGHVLNENPLVHQIGLSYVLTSYAATKGIDDQPTIRASLD